MVLKASLNMTIKVLLCFVAYQQKDLHCNETDLDENR